MDETAATFDKFRKDVLDKPEAFFTASDALASTITQFTKFLFDQAKQTQTSGDDSALETLYVDGFDADQIWEQLKLQNEPVAKEVARQVKKWSKDSSALSFFQNGETSPEDRDEASDYEEQEDDEKEQIDDEDMEDDDEEVEGEDEEEEEEEEDEEKPDDESDEELVEKSETKNASKKRKRGKDELEDGFFDWDEMERAAEEEEADESDDEDAEDLEDEDDEGEDDDDDDFEDEDDDGINEKTATYKDLFDEPKAKGDDSDEDDGDDDEEEEEEVEEAKAKPSLKRKALTEEEEEDLAERGIMSTHQRRSSQLQKQIEALEEEALGDKPWELKGEVKASARPENSLLEATLEYDRPTKVAPIITVEVTQELEEMIKQRIRDEQFDDVIRKFAVNEEAQQEAAELSMEKSKEGLGEIYEKEYMKNAMGFEDNSEQKKDQEEIEVMFQKLCWKLDALTNFHFTPKPIVREMQVQSAAPAISMEEAVPIGVSDANLQAPEDVYDKKHKREGIVRSREEMSQDERKAARNAKKHARRKARKQKEADEKLVAKVNPGMGNKYEKKKLLESLQAKNVTKGKEIEGSTRQFSNSSEFFTRLQEEQQGGGPKTSAKKNKEPTKSASFYKL